MTIFSINMNRKKFPVSIRLHVARAQKWECVGINCARNTDHFKRMLPSSFDIDHIVPLHNGGTNEVRNLQALCPNCHRLKSLFEARQRADRSRERKTKKSRYFDPISVDYLAPIPAPSYDYFQRRKPLGKNHINI